MIESSSVMEPKRAFVKDMNWVFHGQMVNFTIRLSCGRVKQQVL
jgi:hypothetical protein